MRVAGQHGKKPLHRLLDTVSTHNFIDAARALRLNCKVEMMPPMWVKVADVGRLKCDVMVKNFSWKMQGEEFTTVVILLPLSGSDMVLGIQWFIKLGLILWDFHYLAMEFKHEGRGVKLRGATMRNLKSIQGESLEKIMKARGELSMLQVIPATESITPQLQPALEPTKLHPNILYILQLYPKVSLHLKHYPHLDPILTIRFL